MAKPIVLSYRDKVSSFPFQKLDRKKLYATRRRMVLDRDGEPCLRAELMADGSTLIRPGMTGQAYFDDSGRWIPNSDLVGLDGDGHPLQKHPSTLGQAQQLQGPVAPEEVLDMAVYAVYRLDCEGADPELKEAVDGGDIFRFAFNYRPDYHAETAYLVGNDDGWFALVGLRNEPVWCELEKPEVDLSAEQDDDTDDLDFEMF